MSGRRRFAAALLAAGAGVLLAGPAAATNTVHLAGAGMVDPVGALSVQDGSAVSLDLRMDFADETVGGGVLVAFDPAVLRLDGVAFDAALGDDPSLRCPGAPAPATCPGDPALVSFGSLYGLSGERRIAALSFTALANATTAVGVAAAVPFSDTTGDALAVVYLPEPSLPLQLSAALLALAGCRWHHRRRGRHRPG